MCISIEDLIIVIQQSLAIHLCDTKPHCETSKKTYIITFFARLIATTWPSGKTALYTVPKPPSPNFTEFEKLWVALIIWLILRCTDPILLSWGDDENRDGLGGTLGVTGIFSETELNSKDEFKSTETWNESD